jgi:hypothetical protein
MSKQLERTISEDMFEEVCRTVGIDCRRVAEAADARTPDYEVVFSGHRVVAEVKQFDPNAEEAESIRRMEAGRIGGTTATPGDRIRKAIRSAAPQLKARSKGECPTMVVVYNNSGAKQHADPYSVATAMQGLDVVPVLVPKDSSISPQFQDARSGPGKKMTPNANTTISAIGVLVTDFDDQTHLCVYHNRHAVNPIEPDWLRAERVHHFRLPEGAASSLDGWEKV